MDTSGPIVIVSLDAVTKTFPGTPVLQDVTFSVERGRFVSVIGPSGCGKSTIFNLLAGLDTPDSGRVDAPRCAYMPQKDLLFPWRSILDNTTLGLEIQGVDIKSARARAGELFDAFGLAGFEDARPSELSGGMRQRVALLRTVVQGRDVLLLDEPFGALDSLTRTSMQDWLQGMWQKFGWTVLMITHDIREAVYLSDRVIVLSERPAHVMRELTIDLPRPRGLDTITSREFAVHERELLTVLRA